MKEAASHKALLEIGVEELPARFITPALTQLKENAAARLKASGISFSEIEVWGTPRRLVVKVSGIGLKALDRTDVVPGPAAPAAKNAAGEWTDAAKGFARSQNVPVDKLEIRQTAKGERAVALHPVKGQSTESILKELFPALVKDLNFPKNMVWEASQFKFARPIRWFVSLLNSKVVRFTLAGVTADRTTYGLLALGGQRLTVTRPEKYQALLQGRCILVDPKQRLKNIQTQLEAAAKKVKATPVAEAGHLEEVVQLTEYPVCVLAEFPEKYLKLPREILVIVLRKHQRFFPLESSKGKLSNYFVGVRNGPSEHQDDVSEGYERVINARLADAQFFYEHDSQTSLETLAPKLAGVGFHKELGTVWDKTERVVKLVDKIGSEIGLPSDALQDAKRAALLAKADLLTQLVGELPELQGVAGRFYAEKHENAKVALAIEQHYWPITSEGNLPSTEEAALVALADKIDTLAANFSVGLIPSGSADPYGLRRAAIGVIRILNDRRWNLSIDRLIAFAFELLPPSAPAPRKGELKDFIDQRFYSLFENQGFRPDEIESILSNNGQSVSVLVQKLNGLKAVRGRPEFASLSTAIKRASNILKQAREKGLNAGSTELNVADFQDGTEKALFEAISSTRPRLATALEKQNYHEAFLELAPLREPVDAFFNGVMVMVDDEKVRTQRLALLRLVKDLFDSLADFSKLQE